MSHHQFRFSSNTNDKIMFVYASVNLMEISVQLDCCAVLSPVPEHVQSKCHPRLPWGRDPCLPFLPILVWAGPNFHQERTGHSWPGPGRFLDFGGLPVRDQVVPRPKLEGLGRDFQNSPTETLAKEFPKVFGLLLIPRLGGL